ncbi:MAG: hypothetical protein ACM3NT_06070 [Methylocystaceae bacterium]
MAAAIKNRKVIFNQDGSLMLMTIIILLIVTILGSAVISVAGMEAKMGTYNGYILQAQQAADAGLEISTDRVFEYLRTSTETIPVDQKNLSGVIASGPPEVRYSVTIDDSDINDTGVVKIVSIGEVINNGRTLSKKRITAFINYTGESRYAVRSNDIVINGAATFGIDNDSVNIIGGDSIATSRLKTKELTSSNITVENEYLPAVLTQNDVARMAELIRQDALSGTSKWTYMQPSFHGNTYDLSAGSISRPNLFVDMKQNKRLELDMTDWDQINIWKLEQTVKSVIIVSPAAITINFGILNDTMPEDAYIFLMSPEDITINFNVIGSYLGTDSVRLYTLSGNDITVNSYTNKVNITGSLNAANTTTINFNNDPWAYFAAQQINLTPDPGILNSFPYNWALVRVGAITAYSEN